MIQALDKTVIYTDWIGTGSLRAQRIASKQDVVGDDEAKSY